jgi:hypothetical protein
MFAAVAVGSRRLSTVKPRSIAPTTICLQILNAKDTFMVDDVLLNKVANIERCVALAREEYQASLKSFTTRTIS